MDSSREKTALWLCVIAGLLVRLWLILGTELYIDTAYYLGWSERLDWSYFDHPPMIAYFLRVFGLAGTQLVTSIGTVAALAWGSAAFTPGSALRAAALAAVMPVFVIAGAIPNPDSVLFLFSALAFALCLRGHVLTAGIAAGLALLSKYPAILLLPSLLGIAWYHPKRLRILGAVALAALIASPVLMWNVQHDWAGFRFQFLHGTESGAPGVGGIVSLIGAQFPFIGVLALPLMLAWAIRSPRPSLQWALAAGFLIPLLVFLGLGLRSRGEANWPTLCAVAGVIGLVSFTASTKWYWPSIISTGVISLLGAVFLTVPLSFAPVTEPLKRMHGNEVLRELPRDVAAAFSSRYPLSSYVHFYTRIPVGTVGGRPSQFDVWGPPPTPPGTDALWVTEQDPVPHELIEAYESIDEPTTLTGNFGNQVAHVFRVYRLRHHR